MEFLLESGQTPERDQKKMIKDHEFDEKQEMFLERLWHLREKGRNTRAALLEDPGQEDYERLLGDFQRVGCLKLDGDRIEFLPKCEEYTRDIIRRRRLTEVLLYNVLKLEMNAAETNACKIEHIVNQEVADSICAFLGHPGQCPHGHPIPRGKCCQARDENIEPLVKPLTKIPPGKKSRVAFISSDETGVLRRLSSLGIYPGAVVGIRQHRPTAILHAGETDIALEPALVERIYGRLLT